MYTQCPEFTFTHVLHHFIFSFHITDAFFFSSLRPLVHRNGLLKVGDKILAIDRHLFTPNLSHEEAITILCRANGIITLVVARLDQHHQPPPSGKAPVAIRENNAALSAGASTETVPSKAVAEASTTSASAFNVKRSPSEVSDSSKDSYDMVLNTEWTQIECVELESDGAGLGFGIVGGRSSGVIVKTLVPGGPASRVSVESVQGK